MVTDRISVNPSVRNRKAQGKSQRAGSSRPITLGHSPDADDAFMFYALAKGEIETGGLKFRYVLQDIQTLNERAQRGELDVTALSVAAYPFVEDQYMILSSGASIGDGYGPVVVSCKKVTPSQLGKCLIAVPGEMTSAFLALKLYLGCFRHVVVAFDQVFDAVKSGQADAGLIIHEGQLTYRDEGFHLVCDLGRWWKRETGLPLPLGVNVIRKDIPLEIARKISGILSASIRYSLAHRADAVAHALRFGRGLDHRHADRFIGMYVNDYTLDLGTRGQRAIREFLRQGQEIQGGQPLRGIKFF